MSPTLDHPQFIPSLIGLLIVASFTAYYASRKGKNPFLWFLWGCLIGVLAPLTLFFLTLYKEKERLEAEKAAHLVSPDPATIPPANPILLSKEIEQQEHLWYYLDQEHQQIGPVSIVALRELWNTGRLDLTNYVWTKGMKEWKKVDELADLKELLNKHSLK